MIIFIWFIIWIFLITFTKITIFWTKWFFYRQNNLNLYKEYLNLLTANFLFFLFDINYYFSKFNPQSIDSSFNIFSYFLSNNNFFSANWYNLSSLEFFWFYIIIFIYLLLDSVFFLNKFYNENTFLLLFL